MSYTAPQYVDTKEQAILALASVIADEDKGALGDGSVNKALDVLADVLAKQDVQVPQTDAGAILALADYVSGGGGGSSDFTTATVTMQAAEGYGSAMTLICPCIASDYGSLEATGTSAYTEDTSMEFTAVLYKGKALAYFDMPGVNVVVTGSAEYDTIGRAYIITGDCTFTFADA